ncbi:putative NAD-dependent epimerase/dehydratase [Hypoxylon crocopeplum]|nr:putative NAD-dependent epimerase/dehydratase [Hypoxylon crocopeplum]
MAVNDNFRPAYAVLGSTGNCGTALIQNLLKSPHNTIHAYCRNQAKLHRLLPEVVDSKQVRVFEGSIRDAELMTECVRGTKAVFMTVTTNDNVPGCRLNQDTAAIVIQALERIKAESLTGSGLKLPKVILLSSAAIDDNLSRHTPWWFRPVLLTAASNVYSDLRVAEQILRSQSDWVSSIFIKPGGLSVDVPRGHRLAFDGENIFLSYSDLSAGMIEAADDGAGRYEGRNVGVVNAKSGVGAKLPRRTLLAVLVGVARHFCPWLHPYLPTAVPT